MPSPLVAVSWVGTARCAVRRPFICDTFRTPQRGVPTHCPPPHVGGCNPEFNLP